MEVFQLRRSRSVARERVFFDPPPAVTRQKNFDDTPYITFEPFYTAGWHSICLRMTQVVHQILFFERIFHFDSVVSSSVAVAKINRVKIDDA